MKYHELSYALSQLVYIAKRLKEILEHICLSIEHREWICSFPK